MRVCLAIDLGATSGRVIAGMLENDRLKLEEVNRFPTVGVRLPTGYHWDILGLYRSILDGLTLAAKKYGDQISSIGVDTWGVDYALLDEKGSLLGNPFQYRDPRTETAEDEVFQKATRKEIYEETGIQFMFFNTLYQLHAEKRDNPSRMEAASDLLFLPDLLSYWLCGKKTQERSIASTSQLWNPKTEKWSAKLIEALGLKESLFRDVTEPGTVLGALLPHVQEETGLGEVDVVSVAGHDTGSAVCGTPLTDEAPCFLSSGTWSIMGIETPSPVISAEALRLSFSNEAGVEGTTRFLKNICGMWLIEEMRRQWEAAGEPVTYEDLLRMADEAPAFQSLIDPDDARFATPGDMLGRVAGYCRETNQKEPKSKGEFARVAFESLACKYKIVFDALQQLAEREFDALRIVGGGCRNGFLNQFAANALGKPVVAGPIEATSIGNVLMQLKGLGTFSSMAEGRKVVEASFSNQRYEPEDTEAWQDAVGRLRDLLK